MNIAIIRFSSLGDVVLATAILQKLKETYPDCTIDFITDRRFTGMLCTDPRIRSVIPYDISQESFGYMMDFLTRLRRERYDLVIDAHGNPRSVIVSTFASAGSRRRVQKYAWQRRLMVNRHRAWEIPHVVQRYVAAIDSVKSGSYRPQIFVAKDEEDRIRKEIKEKARGKRVVGIAPGAAKGTKIWDIEKTQQLAHSLSGQHGLFLAFFGDETDMQLVGAICRPLAEGYLNLAGKTDFRKLAVYLKACDVVLSTDSGPMHVAVAVNTPVVALFGPTVREFGFSPYDEKSVTISVKAPCRPCSLHGSESCPLGHHQCMKEIEVATVEEAILKLLHGE
jgi:heptosyltransferase-2